MNFEASQGQEESQKAAQEQQQRAAAESARQNLLIRILSNDARERLSRIALVKQERARAIEDFLISAAKNGSIRGGSSEDGRLSESDLLNIINQIEKTQEKSAADSKIKFQRRNTFDDDDDF